MQRSLPDLDPRVVEPVDQIQNQVDAETGRKHENRDLEEQADAVLLNGPSGDRTDAEPLEDRSDREASVQRADQPCGTIQVSIDSLSQTRLSNAPSICLATERVSDVPKCIGITYRALTRSRISSCPTGVSILP
jgi:hypothetical protein